MFRVGQTNLRALAAIIAALCAAFSAPAADASVRAERLVVTTQNVPGWDAMFAGGGVYLFNRPGGYYLGRVFDGDEFFATDHHVSVPQTGGGQQLYYWGSPAASPDTCVWIGPRATSTTETDFVTPTGEARLHQCSADDPARAALAVTPSADRPNDARFGDRFNCPHGGVGGAQETTVAAGGDHPFYYNVRWRRDGDRLVAGDGLPNPSGALTVEARSPILYRYSSGEMSIVYHPVHGWGFVPRAAVAPVEGKWGFESVGSWQINCDERPAMFRFAGANRDESGSFISGPVAAEPVAGDWDGDGHDSTGYLSRGVFELRDANTAGAPQRYVVFGATGDRPVAGDWDGNGTDSPGVYRAGTFYLTDVVATGEAPVVHTFDLGDRDSIPLAGDWDGDGIDTAGTYTNGIFKFARTNTPGAAVDTISFGEPGDQPLAGDWDADGDDDIGIYREGVFVLAEPAGYAAVHATVFPFGAPGDRPITGDWDADGTDFVAVKGPHERPPAAPAPPA